MRNVNSDVSLLARWKFYISLMNLFHGKFHTASVYVEKVSDSLYRLEFDYGQYKSRKSFFSSTINMRYRHSVRAGSAGSIKTMFTMFGFVPDVGRIQVAYFIHPDLYQKLLNHYESIDAKNMLEFFESNGDRWKECIATNRDDLLKLTKTLVTEIEEDKDEDETGIDWSELETMDSSRPDETYGERLNEDIYLIIQTLPIYKRYLSEDLFRKVNIHLKEKYPLW